MFCICGRTEMPEGNQSEWRNALVCNINGVWDTLGIFDAAVTCAVQHGDTLFVAGHFQGVDGEPMGRILGFNEGAWHSYSEPENMGASKLKKINGELYRLSAADSLHGIPSTGVSVRQGGRWVPVGNLPPPDSPNGAHWLFDIIEYNGQLVVTGSINATTGHDVFILEGEDWIPLGGGLPGWNDYGKRLAVYQGELYLGGGISAWGGSPSQSIIRWDGEQWLPVGSGLQVQLNNFGNYGSVEDMLVYRDELIVVGGFRYAGGIPAKCVARWNGTEWCSLGGDIGNYIFCAGVYQDTLLVNSQTLGHIAKFVAPEYENICGVWSDVEQHAPEVPLRAWIQDGVVVLEGLPIGTHEVRIVDATGRLVQQERIASDGNRADMPSKAMREGIYFVHVPLLDKTVKLHVLR